MNVRRPSGSKQDRALACAASCWLPEAPQGPSHPAAARGTRIHAALERSYLTGREADIYHSVRPDELELAKRAVAGRPYVAPAYISWPLVEVECYYRPLVCEGEFGASPDDPPAGVWRGRADAIGRTQGGTLQVLDHKTGSPRHQTPPAKSAQLYFFAAWLASHPESAEDVARDGVQLAVYTTQDGALSAHHVTLDAINTHQQKLAELEAKLVVVEGGGEAAEKVMAENPPIKNKGCFFCPSKPVCPVWAKDQ